MEDHLITEELAMSDRQEIESGHAQQHVAQCLFIQLSRCDVQLGDERVLPLHCAHVIVLQTCNMTSRTEMNYHLPDIVILISLSTSTLYEYMAET